MYVKVIIGAIVIVVMIGVLVKKLLDEWTEGDK